MVNNRLNASRSESSGLDLDNPDQYRDFIYCLATLERTCTTMERLRRKLDAAMCASVSKPLAGGPA